jgi:lactate dehydrogenase-like 2-hydroxyacid dehydrogenase
MRPELLLLQPMMQEIERRLDASYRVHRMTNDSIDPGVARQVRAVITGGATGIRSAVFDALPALEIIAINGVGTDAVDLQRARERGVRVTITPDVLTEDVADMAFGLMLSVSRALCVGDRFVRDESWGNRLPVPPLSRRVHGKRLGIVGLGRIGRAVARRGGGFSMPVAYTGPRRHEDVPYRYEPSLRQLAADSDFLVLATTGGAHTKGMVDQSVLEALGPNGILINVSRGSVVDEHALLAALLHGRLAGAGLDVFANEPNVPAEFFSLTNVVLQPHCASATVEARLAMGELVLANLDAHFGGRPLPSPVV